MLNLSSSQLRQAADLQDKIEALQTELDQLIGTSSAAIPAAVTSIAAPKKRGRPRKEVAPVVVQESPKTSKRTMSPEHKAKIRAAQALRWAKHNAAKAEAPEAAKPGKSGPKKGGMSAAGRAAIAAAQRARWAKAKTGKNKTVVEKKAEAKPEKKRKMSAAGRLAIAAAAKARWAKFRKAKK